MLQVIERVNQRYESTRLAERLKSEIVIKSCIKCMLLSLISCTYAIFCKFPSHIDCWLLNNSAIIIALLSCFALIITLLLSCRIILVYYNPEKLQDRILTSFKRAKSKESKECNFSDWLDLTKVLLEATDSIPASKIYDTINDEIIRVFDSTDSHIELPSYIIRGITSVNEKLCVMQKRPFSVNNGNQILKCLISIPSKLSDDVYRVLWNNLQLQLFYGHEDWVYEYWTAAVQIYDLELKKLQEGSPSFRNPEIVVLKEDVEK